MTDTCSGTSSAAGVPVLGIEPAQNVALVAEAAGVPTLARFFGHELARELERTGRSADLIACNNTLAQVPDLNDFMAGIATLLAPDGLLTIEVPHLLPLLAENQFDTIYHEHFSYFSLGTLRRILARHGLEVVDVDELPTHGGSLRVHGRHAGAGDVSERVEAMVRRERAAGLEDVTTYASFGARVAASKRSILEFLIGVQRDGKTIAGYGAPGKANTMLNYCGIGPDLLPYTVDRNPYKQGRFTPGCESRSSTPDRTRARSTGHRLDPSMEPALARSRPSCRTCKTGVAGLFVAMPTPQILEPGTPVAGAAPQGQGRP